MKKKEIIGISILIVIGIILIIRGIISENSESEEQKQAEKSAENIVREEYVKILQDGTKINVSKELNRYKTVDGLSFKNIQLTNKDGQSVLLADVTNTTGAKTEITLVDVVILDKNGNEIGREGGIIAPLEAGASTQFNTSTTMNYANAYDFKIEKK